MFNEDGEETFRNRLYNNLEDFIPIFLESVEAYIDRYKEQAMSSGKVMFFSTTIPEEHSFNITDVVCHPKVLNFKYNGVILRRMGKDDFSLIVVD